MKIFLILIFFANFHKVLGDTFVLNDNIKLHYDSLIEEVTIKNITAYMENVNSAINKILKRRKNTYSIDMDIYFYYDSATDPDAQRFVIRKNAAEVFVFDLKSINLQKNFKFREELISLIMQSYLGDHEAKAIYKIPRWLALAIDNRINQNNTQNKVTVRVRNMPGLKLLVMNDVIFHPQVLNSLNDNELSYMEWLVLGNFSQFILDLCSGRNNKIILQYISESYICQKNNISEDNLFSAIIIASLEKQAEKYFINDNKLKQSNKKKIPLSDAEKEQKLLQYLKIMANRYSYYSQNPYPANLTKTEFNKLCTIKIPILNEKNEPTDEFEDVHVSKLPQLMRTRPDAQWIKNRTVISFLGFQNSVSSLVKNDIKELVQLLSLCQNSIIWGTSSSALQKHIGEIEKKINEQQGIENFMDETSLDYLNIYQLYPYEMKTVEEYFNSMGSSEIKKFLQETEEKFYDSF